MNYCSNIWQYLDKNIPIFKFYSDSLNCNESNTNINICEEIYKYLKIFEYSLQHCFIILHSSILHFAAFKLFSLFLFVGPLKLFEQKFLLGLEKIMHLHFLFEILDIMKLFLLWEIWFTHRSFGCLRSHIVEVQNFS